MTSVLHGKTPEPTVLKVFQEHSSRQLVQKRINPASGLNTNACEKKKEDLPATPHYQIKQLTTARRQDLGIREQKDLHPSSITFHVATKHSAATAAQHLKGPGHPAARRPRAISLSATSVL